MQAATVFYGTGIRQKRVQTTHVLAAQSLAFRTMIW
jgi:hypothetical protein